MNVRRLVVIWFLVTLGVGLVAAGRAIGGQAQEGTPGPARHPLVGSWRITGEFAEQGTGQPVGAVASIITFTADGNVLVANPIQLPDVPASAGLFFTEGQGAWQATGARGGDVTFVYLTLHQTGHLATTNIVRLQVETDVAGSVATGEFVLDTISESSGPFSPQPRGTFEATRIEVVPIDAPLATPETGTPTP